jgi:hypothetical protein
MITFTFSRIHAGWVTATICAGGEEHAIIASFTPMDAIRDFVDAVASLSTTPLATCRWHQEPTEVQWQLHRTGDDVDINLTLHDEISARRPELLDRIIFQGATNWIGFCKQVLEALLKIRTSLGVDGYEREWGYPFPTEACNKLERAIHSNVPPRLQFRTE